MGAGVAWMQPWSDTFEVKVVAIGKGMGDINDAEMLAVKEALELAVSKSRKGCTASVEVYTDSQTVLTALRDDTSSIMGPTCTAQFALSQVHEFTDILRAAGVGLELRWVKGHNLSRGNDAADAAAGYASRWYIHLLRTARLPPDAALFPTKLREADMEMREACFYRAGNPTRLFLESDPRRNSTGAGGQLAGSRNR
jgi:ribonuclease HI